MALTHPAILKMKPVDKRREVPDGKVAGLYLVQQPKPSNSKSWCVRYRHGGKTRKLTLGPFPVVSIAEARDQALAAILKAKKGVDPIREAKAQKLRDQFSAGNTLRGVCERYFETECGMHRDPDGEPVFNGKGKLRSAHDRIRYFDRLIYPKLGDLPITEVKRTHIRQLLDQVKGERARDLTLAYLRRVLGWYAANHADDDYVNPIVKGMASGTVNKRERSLTDDELRRVWVACDGVGIFGSMVRLLLLTCGRRMEVAGIRRSELSGSDWLLPKTRNKVKEDLLRPLTENAIAILRSIPRFENSDKVFTLDGTRSFGDFARRLKQLHEISGISGWTIHDLRRTARGLLSKAGVQPHVAELCLGHKIKGVAGVYDHRSHYYPQLVLAFRLLAREIDKVVDLQGVAEPADNNVVGNVLPMRA